MNIPSHILINPDVLERALRCVYFQPEISSIPAMLADMERWIQVLIEELPEQSSPGPYHDPASAGKLRALCAASKLLGVIREAVGAEEPAGVAWQPDDLARARNQVVVVTRAAHGIQRGARLLTVATDAGWRFEEDAPDLSRVSHSMSAEAACQWLNDWGAQVVSHDGASPLLFGQEITWLDVIDDALGLVADQEWADEQAEEAQAVVQGILTGHVPLARLLQPVNAGEGVSQIGGEADNGQRATG